LGIIPGDCPGHQCHAQVGQVQLFCFILSGCTAVGTTTRSAVRHRARISSWEHSSISKPNCIPLISRWPDGEPGDGSQPLEGQGQHRGRWAQRYPMRLDQRLHDGMRRQRDRMPGARQSLRKRNKRLYVSSRADGWDYDFHRVVIPAAHFLGSPKYRGARAQIFPVLVSKHILQMLLLASHHQMRNHQPQTRPQTLPSRTATTWHIRR